MKQTIGYALCGSFCTHSASIAILEELCAMYDVFPIVSENVEKTDTRFGKAADTIAVLETLCCHPVIRSITEAEPLGPQRVLDALVIAPCTGNTLAKLTHGITDTTVTMAAKAHLRADRPLLAALASNDAMSVNLANIGAFLNRKCCYLVPMRQDDIAAKPHSLVADFSCLPDCLSAALRGQQVRPLFL